MELKIPEKPKKVKKKFTIRIVGLKKLHVLFVILGVLKLTKTVDLPWSFIFIPFWFAEGGILTIFGIFATAVYLFQTLADK